MRIDLQRVVNESAVSRSIITHEVRGLRPNYDCTLKGGP